MIQFYCKFIPDCAEILAPLYSLLSIGARMTQLFWSPETENCFLKAKQAIEKATVLAHPNHEANLKLITDASDSAVGAVLQQISNGLRQPLAFWSKTLTTFMVLLGATAVCLLCSNQAFSILWREVVVQRQESDSKSN